MKIEKLFVVLVMGGAALAAGACGPGQDSPNPGTAGAAIGAQDDGGTPADGGSPGGNPGGGGGGPGFW
jgi:hypothetical protein